MKPIGRILSSTVLILLLGIQTFAQVPTSVHDVAKGLKIGVKVNYNTIVDNNQTVVTIPGSFTLEVNSPVTIPANWTFGFCSDFTLGYVPPSQAVPLFHLGSLGGCIQVLSNTRPIPANTPTKANFTISGAAVSRFDFIPGWYLADRTTSALIPQTAVEDLSYIQPFTTTGQTLRILPYDSMFYPHTLGKRYIEPQNIVNDVLKAQHSVIPTPKQISPITSANSVKLGSSWVFKLSNPTLLATKIANPAITGSGEVILQLNATTDKTATENYELYVTSQSQPPVIHISAYKEIGIFYGIQTLLSLRQEDGSVPNVHIKDSPHYPYRGLMVDLSYNFLGTNTLMKLLDDGSPCTDFSRRSCVFNPYSVISDMTSTSAKYFTEAEYKKLLQHANKNYIQIIPYFDLDSTGAARAALRNVAKALPPNVYTTVHKCYRYKYIFFETVLKTLKKYHSDVNHPLTQVVLSQKDFLNLDHASEPHPEEPGDNYATRFLDARRVYNYLPRNPCCNYMQDMYFWGYQGFQTPSRSGCFPRGHPYCQFPDQTLNIEGVQAKVLTRKIRTEEQLFKALLPRLIAFAERAWHKAPWETYFKPAAANTAAAITAEQTNVDEGVKHRDQHWAQLRNVIGNKELNRLTKMGLKFNIPLPGVSLGNATVENKVTTFPVLTSQLYPGTKDNTGYSRETALTNVEFFSPGVTL
ncbi:hypothetical protein KUTeg_022858 [Tegillarca granosa]|uniref:beta-N-acetylhexosaminidase n=1 Tax=Tegillarca granosa TaxID=220873 RepID=A0ABQ9E684_TEGGR|nr:hypothetical protein KUTeg_022858 [Tegillarca granosa]